MRIGGSGGIVSYFWSEDSKGLLIPSSDSLYYCELKTSNLKKLKLPDASKVDAKLSPKSSYVSYIDGVSKNLYVYNLVKDE